MISLLGAIFEILCFPASEMYKTFQAFSLVILKGYLVYIIAWMLLFTFYILCVSNVHYTEQRNEKFEKAMKRFLTEAIVIFVGVCALVIMLPMDLYYDGIKSYTTGAAVNVAFALSGFCVLVWLFSILRNFKKVDKKKIIPVFVLIIGGTASILIQRSYPHLILSCFSQTLVTFLMYFTISNPDLKMMREMELAKDGAEKANNFKTDFITNMSHEIRTPLTAIIGFSEEITKAKTLEQAKEDADEVVKSSKILLEIVGGILDMSKLESGNMEINEDTYNPQEMFDAVISSVGILMREKKLEFNVSIDPTIPLTLYGDKVSIQKIVMNLLSNAYKYTSVGRVNLNVSSIVKNGICGLTIAVEDSGRGIKTENIDKLFEKFNRLEEDKNTTTSGTGLGLAITKKLVELMGGKIVVQSMYGQGSKFTVFLNQQIKTEIDSTGKLPIYSDNPEPVLLEKSSIGNNVNVPESYPDYSGKIVLITDDNSTNIKVASRLLSKYKLNVATSLSALETRNKINNGEKFDLLLMDIEMPVEKGDKAMQNLKQMGYIVPIVALTANATEGDRKKYIDMGFDEYISKPVNTKELAKVLDMFLGNSAAKESQSDGVNKGVADWSKAATTSFDATTQIDVSAINEQAANKSLFEEALALETQVADSNQGNINFLKTNGADIEKALTTLLDMDFYNETLEDLQNQVSEKMSLLRKYKDTGDMPNYAIEVHSLKSDFKTVGFYDMAEKYPYQHEVESKNNNADFVNANFEELEKVINHILSVIKEYLGK